MLFPSRSQHLSSKYEPFASARQKPAVLQRPVKIVTDPFSQDDDTIRIILARSMEGVPDVLPQGTEIRFDTFILHKDSAFLIFPTRIEYTAWFFVPSLNLPEGVRFEYLWGTGRYLRRAPWEDDTVPSQRYVGSDGSGYRPK